MDKATLLQKLDRLIRLESYLAPLLDQHIHSALGFSDLPAADQKQMRKELEILAHGERQNAKRLREIKAVIEASDRNEY